MVPRSGIKETKNGILWSILILSLPERVEKCLIPLLQILQPQCEKFVEVELLILTDNKWRSIGEKRTNLLQLAHGKYISFVDDDDMVTDNYVEEVFKTLKQYPNAQTVVFDAWVTGWHIVGLQSDKGSLCRYGLEYPHANMPDGSFRRKPNHWMVIDAGVAKKYTFPPINDGEDTAWANSICNELDFSRQYRILKILYKYTWDVRASASGVGQTNRKKLGLLEDGTF